VLGGHDHHYASKLCPPHNTWYVKSGADFRYLSKITITPGAEAFDVEKMEITREVLKTRVLLSFCTVICFHS
jgi:hypothetical protein